MYGRTHLALKYLSQLIPPASSFLLPILTEIFPYASDSKRAHSAFVKNILKTIDYIPELRSDILALIADRLVKIDVQVQVDVEDLADDVENGLVQGIPKLKGKPSEGLTDSEDESNAESDDSDEELDPDTLRAKEIANNVEKLDMVMDMLFAYYDTSFPGVSADDREDLLLSQFSHIILQTYRSRHVQFLLFHFSQTSPASVDNFVGTCITIAFDKHRSAVMRQSAAAYLASFVARGNHVGPQIVRMVFEYLGLRLSELRADHERACRGPDLQRYSTYYSLVQALLYIFCFRWPALEVSSADEADSDSDLEEHNRVWIPGLKETLEQNIFSKLNPLKVCSPAIVTEFAKVANHLSVVFVYGLLETNKRLRLTRTVGVGERETALSGRKDEALQQLDGYFPFDPYHLPRSKRWVEADYRIWKGIPGLHDKDTAEDEESGSDEEAEDDSEGEEGTATDEGED
jgi:RNA polymerase I-specific transcription initiation factor RRN3